MKQRVVTLLRFLATAGLLIILCAACAVEKAPVYRKDGKEFGVTEGLFRSRWWNYYERGCSYAEGEYWQEAEADFKQALGQRDEDRRRARTYGVLNFIDYFPHRELGVCYYYQGRYREAIDELERSTRDTPSAKAYYFLDKARREWLLREGLDVRIPTLMVGSPEPDEITNAFQVRICGIASDDTFVSRLQVGETEVPLEVSRQEVPFCVEAAIGRGRNIIPLAAEDIVGRRTEIALTVICDREGPQLALEDLSYRDLGPGREVALQGYVDDEHFIRRVSINAVDLPLPAEHKTSLFFSHILRLGPDENRIVFLTEDIAGNRNEGIILLEFPKRGEPAGRSQDSLDGLTRLAWLSGREDSAVDAGFLAASSVTGTARSPAMGERSPPTRLAANVIHWRFPGEEERIRSLHGDTGPTIRLKELDETQRAYVDTIYVEGSVQGPHPIRTLTLNDVSLLKREGRSIFFGIFWRLDPGDNDLVFLAEDERGRRTQRRIRIEYVVPRVLTMESRLSVFVIPFQPVRCEPALGEYVSQHFTSSLVRQGRFRVVNREELDRTLLEQHLSQSGLVDPKTAVKIGRVANADEALVGSVYEGRNSVEIFVQMIDTETGEILLEKDVFHEEKSPERIRSMTDGLALKFKTAMPLVQGNILKLEGAQLFADIGKEESLRKGTRLVVFREGAELVHPETGRTLGCETRELGEAIVRRVEERQSVGELTTPRACEAVSLHDRVITK